MLKYEDIIDAPLAKLQAAVEDWAEMTAKLETLARDAMDGMNTRAGQAGWEGVNAGVTKEFIAKTAKEFSDAHAEAKGVHQILTEGHTFIKKAHDDLVNIRDHEGPAANIKVDGRGTASARDSVNDIPARQRAHDPDYPDMLRRENERVAAWQRRIDQIVDNCADSDLAFKNSLEANVTDRKDFNAPTYTKLDQEEAARAAALAGKGSELTHTELQALNELLKDNSGSVEFAKNFYERLGPEKSLVFFGQLAGDTYNYTEVDAERLKDVQELQRNLGLNLATASHDKAFTAEWGPELRKLGTERIPLVKYDHNPPFGYQLLGGIMRYGNYDAKFLNPMAEHVAQLRQKDPDLFAENKGRSSASHDPFNPSGVNGAGYDPMTSMLEALGNSPEAAKRFFTDPPTAYNEDGTVNHGATADLGKSDGTPIDNYLDFFTRDKWQSEGFADTNTHDPGLGEEALNHMPDALGKALEAATLGYPAGNPDPNVLRDADNAGVMQKVMEKYGADPDLLREHQALSDSLGTMGAGYVDDINWALEKNDPDSPFAPGRNPDGRIDFAETEDGDGRSVVRGFLSALGQYPDAYATLSTAEQVYTRSVLEQQVNPDGTVNVGAARAAVNIGAEVQGMLDQSRADQVQATNLKTHEDYEKAVQKRSGWIEFGATVGVAAGVAFLPVTAAVGTAAVLVPLATDTASGALEQGIGQIIGDISGNSIDQHKEKVEDLNATQRIAIYSAGERLAEAPMEAFLRQHREAILPVDRQDFRESMKAGYSAGNDRENQQGHDPVTD
ncbi:hypothetical protein AB0D49_34745 [Streptomyces sp. NPDC048290]|uniref:hypothetical protein n=1 Tax=Streptomyces sp. NPDC048290 TaxID=3155811 RepID=UPI0034454C54